MTVAGCNPVRPPTNRRERIHAYFHELVETEFRLRHYPQEDRSPRNVLIPLYVITEEFETPEAFEITTTRKIGIDTYTVPFTHRLAIQQITSFIGIDSWTDNHGGDPPLHGNLSPNAENVEGMILAEAMVPMLALRNTNRGTNVGVKLFRDFARENGNYRLNAATILSSLGCPSVDFGNMPYIVLPSEELRLEIRGPNAESSSTQMGILISGALIPTDEVG